MAEGLTPTAAYALWADTYRAEPHNPLMEAEQRIVERILMHVRARRALDVGTGSGRYLPILQASAPTVVGVDLSMPMLRHARGRRVCADALRLPFRRATFDLVNASLMVGDLVSVDDWMREMARILAPRGHLVYSDFHPCWGERGWRRTFRDADGVQHTIAFTPHSMDDHLAAVEAAGLRLHAIREPKLAVGGELVPVLAIVHASKDWIAPR